MLRHLSLYSVLYFRNNNKKKIVLLAAVITLLPPGELAVNSRYFTNQVDGLGQELNLLVSSSVK